MQRTLQEPCPLPTGWFWFGRAVGQEAVLVQSSSTEQTPSDHEGGRGLSELLAIVAEMNNVVTVIAGYAELLAREQKPRVIGTVLRSVTRYRALSQRLHRELDKSGQAPHLPRGL